LRRVPAQSAKENPAANPTQRSQKRKLSVNSAIIAAPSEKASQEKNGAPSRRFKKSRRSENGDRRRAATVKRRSRRVLKSDGADG
jgi:hypothetical protein